MFKKKIKLSEGFLIAVLIYSGLISVLYFRMKHTERILVDYNDRLCPSPSDCRIVFKAEILDYGSDKVSFTNYGPRGIPLEGGTFEEYLVTLSTENLETSAVKVLPNSLSDVSGFDLTNIYIPTKSDPSFLNGSLFDKKSVDVEVWRGKITFILLTTNLDDTGQLNENQVKESISIGPLNSINYETVIPTENHPVILAEFAKNDLTGWTSGVVFMVLAATIIGGGAVGLIYGTDWIIRRWRKDE